MFRDCCCSVFFACGNVGTMSLEMKCERRNMISTSNVVTFVTLAVVFVCCLCFFLHYKPRAALFLQHRQKQYILLYFLCLACAQSWVGLSISKWMPMKFLGMKVVRMTSFFYQLSLPPRNTFIKISILLELIHLKRLISLNNTSLFK